MHLEYRTLSAFVDGEVGESSLAAVRAHLGTCSTCRDEIRFIRKLGAALRKLPSPAAPQGFIDEIFPKEPGQGDVVPLFDRAPRISGASRSRWALTLVACLSGLLVGFLALTLGPDRVMAGSSTMTLERAGAGTLTVRYETVSSLSAEPALRARIRYWIPDSLRFTQTKEGFVSVELEREDAGRFEGAASLPPGTVYAMATVEDERGDRIDTNRGRFWEYIERDEQGQPTLQGRLYQMLAASEISVSRVIQVAGRAAAEFPERPEFWAKLLLFTPDTPPVAATGGVAATGAGRLELLDAAARQGDPGPHEMYALRSYSGLLGRRDVEEYWDAALVSRYPLHEYSSQIRLRKIVLSSESSRRKLDALDQNWQLSPTPALAQVGLQYSYEFADSALTRAWLDRYASESALRDLQLDVETAERMIEVPALRPLAEEWILDRLDHTRDWRGAARPLDQTRGDFDREAAEIRARLNLGLGRILLYREDTAEAFEAVARAAAQSWTPDVFFQLAKLHRTAGSLGRASELLLLALADPVTPITASPSLEEEKDALSATEAQLLAARTAWREHLGPTLLDQPLNRDASLRDLQGERITLREATEDRLTLVLQGFWLSHALADRLDLLRVNAKNLEAADAGTLFVAAAPVGRPGVEDAGADRSRGFPPVYHDDRFEVWDALGASRQIQYFVLDRSGSLRHRGEDLATAIRITLVLGGDSVTAAGQSKTKKGVKP